MTAHEPVQVTTTVSSSIPQRLSTRSPRSSIDSSPKSPNSPFLHNLSNRFRKGSNASTFSHASETHGQSQNGTDKIGDTAQSAKRFVLSVVRNDWEWPPPQPDTAPGGENVTAQEKKQDNLLARRDPVGWRTRFEGASDLELDLSPVSGKRLSRRSSDPYKFESPDSIANAIQQQRLKRKRANAEEVLWNTGLQYWTKQRDAWTATQSHIPQTRSLSRTNGQHSRTLSTSTRRKNSQLNDKSKPPLATESPEPPVLNGINGAMKASATTGSPEASDEAEEDTLNGPFLPIYPPLFPSSHTLRARIKPTSYPTIYSKVVLQSLTPNVPIPLTHMIGALVDGWKAEGQWPPQTLAEQQTHALLRRAKGATKPETAFQKWRKERDAERANRHQHSHDGGGGSMGNGGEIAPFEDGFAGEFVSVEDVEKKKGFRKSISGAVKKALRMPPKMDGDGGLAKLGLSFGADNETGSDDDDDDDAATVKGHDQTAVEQRL